MWPRNPARFSSDPDFAERWSHYAASMESRDLYALLGVSRTATSDEIRNAYRDCAMQHHPDRGGEAKVWASIQHAYDTLSEPQRRATYDRTKQDGSAGAEKQFGQSFADKSEGSAKKGGLSIVQQIAEAKQEGGKAGALATAGYDLSHAQGFDAWVRNQKGLGKHNFYNAEDLLRSGKYGNIEATGTTSQPLPPLSASAIRFDAHGPAEEVLYVERECAMPEKLGHGEVLVHMLAACVTDEDLLRVQTPLTVLNNFPPFNRTNNKWEEVPLPATAGVEGVGIVIATAKNVPLLKEHALEVKDWVVVRPEARRKPVGCWSTMCVVDSSMLVKVPAHLMPVSHLACSRSLCTAYRLLEDFGGLRPGDTIIQNAADLPVGQAVVQLCHMLKIRSINLVPDDASFDKVKAQLVELGASHVLRDNGRLGEFVEALGQMMPRLAIDALGGEAGKRMSVALRPGGQLVMYSLQSGSVPVITPSLLMYQQISLHGFSLPQWVDENGVDAYREMLDTIGELVKAGSLQLATRDVHISSLDGAKLAEALSAHRVPLPGGVRARSVLVLGDEATASEVYFELQANIRALYGADEPAAAGHGAAAPAATAAAPRPVAASLSAQRPRASERWADAAAMLADLSLSQYASAFEEEEMTSMELLEDIVSRGDGEKELMDALKEMGIKKMGHRQAIVGAVVGKL